MALAKSAAEQVAAKKAAVRACCRNYSMCLLQRNGANPRSSHILAGAPRPLHTAHILLELCQARTRRNSQWNQAPHLQSERFHLPLEGEHILVRSKSCDATVSTNSRRARRSLSYRRRHVGSARKRWGERLASAQILPNAEHFCNAQAMGACMAKHFA